MPADLGATRRLGAAVLVVAGLLLAAGTALAYWSSAGSGTAAASTGTLNAPTGVSATFASGSVTVATSTGTAWTAVPGCSAADYTVGTPSFTPGDIASGASKDGTVTITMNNLGTNQDACKNVTVPLYFAAS